MICHGAEKPYIEGTKQFGGLERQNLKTTFESMPESLRGEMKKLIAEAMAYKGVAVTNTVEDGDVLPLRGGITVIHTPGHTEGHICLYMNESGLLVAGDELDLVDGGIVWPQTWAFC